jgi:hypothetical protein
MGRGGRLDRVAPCPRNTRRVQRLPRDREDDRRHKASSQRDSDRAPRSDCRRHHRATAAELNQGGAWVVMARPRRSFQVRTEVCTRCAFPTHPARMNRVVERKRFTHTGKNGRTWDRTRRNNNPLGQTAGHSSPVLQEKGNTGEEGDDPSPTTPSHAAFGHQVDEGWDDAPLGSA